MQKRNTAADASADSATTTAITPAPKMLIVDDDAYVGRALSRIIGEPWEITLATDGPAALAGLEAGEVYDCILCDVRMPTMGGEGFLAAVRALGSGQHERVVFVTGGRQLRDVEEFLATVPNRCLEKPFSLQSAREAVQSVAPHFRWPTSGVWRRTP